MLPLLILAGAGVWFALAAIYYGMPTLAVAGLSMVGAGFFGAYLALRRESRWGAVGAFVLAAAGMGFFLGPAFGAIDSVSLSGSHLFMLGIAGLAVALAIRVASTRDSLMRLAGFLAAAGALCWVWSDARGGLAWEPGNVASAVGMAWIALQPEAIA